MSKSPHITVIIPTRERCDVLEKSLKTVTSQDYDGLEIIVSDNNSTDQTREVVLAAKDPRVRHVNTGKRRSMTGNWEFGLSHVNDGWVAILGDDDGFLPGALKKAASIIEATGVTAVRSIRSYYTWPSLLGQTRGRLRIPLGHGFEVREARPWLERLMRGEASYVELPMLYDGGFVHTSLIDTLRARTGSVYRSVAPDIYSAVAIASIVDRYAYVHEPFAIAGTSGHSTGAALWSGNKATDSPIKKFTAEPNLPSHEAIPLTAEGGYPRSTHVFVYDAYLLSAALREEQATTHEQQLELVLALAKRNQERDVLAWGQLFADAHALDFDMIVKRSRLKRTRFRMAEFAKRVQRSFDEITVSSDEVPVRDVYEASLVAAAVREAPPGLGFKLTELARSVRRTLERQIRR